MIMSRNQKDFQQTPASANPFDELLAIHQHIGLSLSDKYARMRRLLENVSRTLCEDAPLQFPNLFARINYLIRIGALPRTASDALHGFRTSANKVVHGEAPTEAAYGQDLRALAEGLAAITGMTIPEGLRAVLPPPAPRRVPPRPVGKKKTRLRAEVVRLEDDGALCVVLEEDASQRERRVELSAGYGGGEFTETLRLLWPEAQVNLVDVVEDEAGTLHTEFVILEPDYLLDASSLAACHADPERNTLHYFKNALSTKENSVPILLGHAANYLLDVVVNAREGEPLPPVNALLRKIFRSMPFEFSTNAEMQTEAAMAEFVNNCTAQYGNIQACLKGLSTARKLPLAEAVLEPSFLCETLGIQGRMDFYHSVANGATTILELKSGKAPWPYDDLTLVKEDHEAQTMLYEMAAQYSLGQDFRGIGAHVLYSKYRQGALRATSKTRSKQKRLLDLRNCIVAAEHQMMQDMTGEKALEVLRNITAEVMIPPHKRNNNFINTYIRPQLERFAAPLAAADETARRYFAAFYAFIIREQWTAKAGDAGSEQSSGVSGIWNRDREEKLQAGDILCDLAIEENKAAGTVPTVRLSIPDYTLNGGGNFLPNFRPGDLVMLYAQKGNRSDATKAVLLKGSIESISKKSVTVRLRFAQRNTALLSAAARYSIEHDFLDASFTAMLRGLYTFLVAPKERRDLLLGVRAPRQRAVEGIQTETDLVKRAVIKARAAQDYFLLIGPPGTGKTSRALRDMVADTLATTRGNILLLSYTNRAVDEICKALEDVPGAPAYIRIGNELSCEEAYRPRLLERVVEDCNNRAAVRERLAAHRIFVGTTSSVAGKSELFKLTRFETAIVDEASQILEPQLLSILCAQHKEGICAVERFILIGDHKQLPAVVLQPEKASVVEDSSLNALGITDRRMSLFERLYRRCKAKGVTDAFDMLIRQGRMHPALQDFPSKAFYGGRLETVPTPHQQADHRLEEWDDACAFERLLARKRLAFVPSKPHEADKMVTGSKTHAAEAELLAELAAAYVRLCRKNGKSFSCTETLGIIAPYRSQIALIRQKLAETDEPELADISVDTVERYQGSQRDCILYSFCVSRPGQIRFLSSAILDEGEVIDRKLNVALTRAREQLVMVGDPVMLGMNGVYSRLMDHCREVGAWVEVGGGR